MNSRKSIIYRGGARSRAFSASVQSSSKSLSQSEESFQQKIQQAQGINRTMYEPQVVKDILQALAPSSDHFRSSHHRKIKKYKNEKMKAVSPLIQRGSSNLKRGKTKQSLRKDEFSHEIEQSDQSIFHFDDNDDEINLSESESPIHINFDKFEIRAEYLRPSEEKKEREFFEKREEFYLRCLPENNSVFDIATDVLAEEMNDFHKQRKLGLFNFEEGRAQDKYQARRIHSETRVERYLFEYQENQKERPKMRIKRSVESAMNSNSRKTKSEVSADQTQENLIQSFEISRDSFVTTKQIELPDKVIYISQVKKPQFSKIQIRMNTTLIVIMSLMATLMLILFAMEGQIQNLIPYTLTYMSFLTFDYLQRKDSMSDLWTFLKLQSVLMLAKSIVQAPESNTFIDCINRNSLYLQMGLVMLTQVGRRVQKSYLLIIPIGINLLHTFYLNSNFLLAIQGEEFLEFRNSGSYNELYQITIFIIGLITSTILWSNPRDIKTECQIQKEVFNLQIEPQDIQIEEPKQVTKHIPKMKVSDLAINHSIIIEESSVSSSSKSQKSNDIVNPRELKTTKQQVQKEVKIPTITPPPTQNQYTPNQIESSLEQNLDNSAEFLLENSSWRKSKSMKMSKDPTPVSKVRSTQMNFSQKHAVMDFILSDLCSASFLCKIFQKQQMQRDSSQRSMSLSRQNRRKRNSKANLHQNDFFINQTYNVSLAEKLPQNQRVKQVTSRKIDIEVMHFSQQFFTKNPAYAQVEDQIVIQGSQEQPSFLLNDSDGSRNGQFRMNLPGDISSPHGGHKISSNQSLRGKISNIKSYNNISLTSQSLSTIRKRSSSKIDNLMFTETNKKLTEIEQLILDSKIYQPYFITHNTIIQFEQQAQQYAKNIMPEKYSIMDILQTHFFQNKNKNKLFFKVDTRDLIDNEEPLILRDNYTYNTDKQTNSLNFVNKSKVNSQYVSIQNNSMRMNKMEEIKESKELSEIERGGSCEESSSKQSKPGSNFYRRIPLIKDEESSSSNFSDKLNKSLMSDNSSKTSAYYSQGEKKTGGNQNSDEDRFLYFEFELRQIQDIEGVSQQNLTFLNIRDISLLVKSQSKFYDQVYQEALENNFSHEQMTPLNPILSHSELIKKHIITGYLEKLKIQPNSFVNKCNLFYEGIEVQQLAKIIHRSSPAKTSLQWITSIEQSARLMWYYNTNLISRMKIKKNQLNNSPVLSSNFEEPIRNVLWPFEHFIFRMKINIFLGLNIEKNLQVNLDWSLYELILFNIIQNSVKYNQQQDGDICILISIKQLNRPSKMNKTFDITEHEHVLETQIIDTGIGIAADRQEILFVPFKELKDRIGIAKSQNDNIGIGLSCSKEICLKMGGDIKLKQSQKGLTVMAFKLPVKISFKTEFSQKELSSGLIGSVSRKPPGTNNRSFIFHKLIGNNRQMMNQLSEYLKEEKFWTVQQCNESNQGLSIKSISHTNMNNSKKIGFQDLEEVENVSVKESTQQKNSTMSKFGDKSIRALQRQISNAAFSNFKRQNNNKFQYDLDLLTKFNKQGLEQLLKRQKSTIQIPQINNSIMKPEKRLSFKASSSAHKGQKHPQSQYSGLSLASKIQGLKHNSLSKNAFKISKEFVENENAKPLLEEKKNERYPNMHIPIEPFEEEKVPNKQNSKNSLDCLNRQLENVSESGSRFVFDEEEEESKSNEDGQTPISRALQLNDQNRRQSSQSARPQGFDYSQSSDNKIELNFGNLADAVEGQVNEEQKEQSSHHHQNSAAPALFFQPQRQKPILELNPNQSFVRRINTQGLENIQALDKKVKLSIAGRALFKNNLVVDQLINPPQQSSEPEESSDSEIETIYDIDVNKRERRHSDANSDILIVQEAPSALPILNDQQLSILQQLYNQSESADQNLSMRGQQNLLNDISNNQLLELFVQYQDQQLDSGLEVIQDENEESKQSAPGDSHSREREAINNEVNLSESISQSSQNIISLQGPLRRSLGPNHISQQQDICDCEPKILIAEDNVFNMMAVVSIIFDKYKIKPTEAANGKIAIDMFKEAMDKPCKCANRAFKLIFMDIQMPVKDGYQATEEILKMVEQEEQSRRVRQNISADGANSKFCTIVALTSYTTSDVEARCLNLGMKRVIFKPLNAVQLKECIDTYFYGPYKIQRRSNNNLLLVD